MPTSPIRPSATARPTTPPVECGCQSATALDQACRGHGIEPGADLEHHEQHGGKHRQAADQAPLRMQEQFVEPVAPAAALVRRAHARAGLEQRGGAVMAVGMQFLFQRPRQLQRRLAAQLLAVPAAVAGSAGAVRPGNKGRPPRTCVSSSGCGTRNAACISGRSRAWLKGCRLSRMCLLGGCGSGQAASRAVSTAVANNSEMPWPISATVGTTGMPNMPAQGLDVDVQALLPGLVHHVQRDDHGPAQLGQFQREFQMAFQAGGIDHLNDQVRAARTARAVRPVRAPIRADARRPTADISSAIRSSGAEVMQGMDARQVDHAGFVEADLNGAFSVGAVRAGQFCRCAARCSTPH